MFILRVYCESVRAETNGQSETIRTAAYAYYLQLVPSDLQHVAFLRGNENKF